MLALGNMDCRSTAAEDGTCGSAKDCVLGNWVIWNHLTQWPSLVWLESNFTYRILSQDTAVSVTAAGVACSHTPGVTCGACHSTAVTNQLTRSTAAGYVRRLRDLSSAMFCWMLAAVISCGLLKQEIYCFLIDPETNLICTKETKTCFYHRMFDAHYHLYVLLTTASHLICVYACVFHSISMNLPRWILESGDSAPRPFATLLPRRSTEATAQRPRIHSIPRISTTRIQNLSKIM